MTIERTSTFPRPRTLVHPGEWNPVRMQTRACAKARHFRLSLPAGTNLYDSLVQLLASSGVRSASTTLLGGHFRTLQYCTAPEDPLRQSVVAYGQPIQAYDVYMIFGNATLGRDSTGKALVHCHAALCIDGKCLKGGHLLPQTSIIGSEPLTVFVTTLDDVDLALAFDAETNIALLQPLQERSS